MEDPTLNVDLELHEAMQNPNTHKLNGYQTNTTDSTNKPQNVSYMIALE